MITIAIPDQYVERKHVAFVVAKVNVVEMLAALLIVALKLTVLVERAHAAHALA